MAVDDDAPLAPLRAETASVHVVPALTTVSAEWPKASAAAYWSSYGSVSASEMLADAATSIRTLPPAGVPWEEGVFDGCTGLPAGDTPDELVLPSRRDDPESDDSELDTLFAASFNRVMTPRAERRTGIATRDFDLPPLLATPLASPDVEDTVSGVGASDADVAESAWAAMLASGGLTATGIEDNTVTDNL